MSDVELQRLRLILSVFRDGTGQNVLKNTGKSMPGFRDYERGLATVLSGYARENKGVFDVVVPVEDGIPFGISCKMAAMQPPKNNCSFMELSNSAAKFKRRLLDVQVNWATEPTLAGPVIVDLVTSWHHILQDEIDVDASKYAVLAHDSKWRVFELLCFPMSLTIANPRGEVDWRYEGRSINGYATIDGRRHRLWQCYLDSGGQLKYYPPFEWASWRTGSFQLEEPPQVSLAQRAADYFPELWQ